MRDPWRWHGPAGTWRFETTDRWLGCQQLAKWCHRGYPLWIRPDLLVSTPGVGPA